MSDNDKITGAKRRVGDAVLGQHGVHGVGTARSAGEVVLRVDPKEGGLPEPVLRKIQSLAEPFGLRVIEEERASFATPD